MQFEHLRYLITLNQYRSITTAAEALHISPQALGAAIRHMEETLQLTLFERTHHGVRPTAAGQEVIAATESYLADCQMLSDCYAPRKAPAVKTLSCVAVPYITHYMLPKIITAFYKAHPHMQLLVQEMDTPTLCQALTASQIEFALYLQLVTPTQSTRLSSPQLKFHKIQQGKLVCYVPRTWPVARQQSINLQELLQLPLLAPQLQELQAFAADVPHFDETAKNINTESIYIMQEMARQGICAISALSWEDNFCDFPLTQQNMTLLTITDNIQAEFGYLTAAPHRLSKASAVFLDFIQRESFC